jgi:hypothetical protein
VLRVEGGFRGLEDKVKVLYIAGHERSGTTLLQNVLGQLDGFFAAGELRRLWDRGLIQNRHCRCGVPFQECDVWRRILDEGFGGAELIEPHEVTRLRNRIRNRHFPLALLPWSERLFRLRLGDLPQHLSKLYRAIRFSTDSRVIVESSGSPTYAHALGMVPEIDLYVVHLVRDPRGVQYSLLKRKTQGGRYLKHNSIKGALAWDALNLATETMWRGSPHRYLRLRFEDFVREPQETIEHILGMIQERVERFPLSGKNKAELGPTHGVGGSPSGLDTGTVELRLDEAWIVKMKPSDKVVTTTLTWPLLLRYGYL